MTDDTVQIDSATLSKIRLKLERKEASELTRQIMQGHGKPIVSFLHRDYRCVAVKDKIYYSKKWLTFVDFLFDFLVGTLTKEWLHNEEQKDPEDRHPILSWFYKTRDFTVAQRSKSGGELVSGVPIGATRALIGLAYDFYLCAHNWELPDSLVKRVRSKENFEGALYEAFVIGTFSKAGFELEFEEESKGFRKHCEFTATHKQTGRKLSVEAKAVKNLNTDTRPAKMKIHRKLRGALDKDTAHDRVVFIELCQADKTVIDGLPVWAHSAVSEIRSIEQSAPAELPSAYLFLSNRPFVHELDDENPMESVAATGSKIPDFPAGRDGQSFRQAITSRNREREIYALMTAINTHTDVPTSFDDHLTEEVELPDDLIRLKIGDTYMVPNEKGDDVTAVLTDAVVLENEARVSGTYLTFDGQRIIATTPISDAELKLYRRSPETFFGVPRNVGKGINSPFDAYDFIAQSYENASMETLVKLTSSWPDASSLRNLSRDDLYEEYCMRMGEQIWHHHLASLSGQIPSLEKRKNP